ncbi:MAG TPA: PQQ-dependent sugar dehydrogenase [Candidatus Saccharimonadales bacterium]|nr:PQQ-dependent sugar dehydrogenase [Candidatus Saccharimonadales bacterium]
MESSGPLNFGQHHHVGQDPSRSQKWRSWLYIGLMIFAAATAGWVIWWAAEVTTSQQVQLAEASDSASRVAVAPAPAKATEAPHITTEVVVTGRENVWDVGFLPDKTMLFTERKGVLTVVKDGQTHELAKINDVRAVGEGGLMGLAVDPKFSENRYIYTCLNTTHGDIRVLRWKVSADATTLEDRTDVITGIPQNSSGRHSGCRLSFGPDDYLWVVTGDSAQNDTIPQNPKSLGGKVLRVDREGKAAASGNLGGNFDSRIFSYGHRNLQGIAFFAKPVNGVLGLTVEHGSYQDDEVNVLTTGNFGWSPGVGYNELGIPMTDKARFPEAIDAAWSSGNPTIAPSGATILKGKQWKLWEGWLAMAVLKGAQLRLLEFTDKNAFVRDEILFKNEFGRLRTAVLGPDNVLYLTTDNGKNSDKIIRVIPN